MQRLLSMDAGASRRGMRGKAAIDSTATAVDEPLLWRARLTSLALSTHCRDPSAAHDQTFGNV
jgi:hypothetical protein